MEHTLIDVNIAMATQQETTFRNVRCHIVNYTAKCEWPNKFFYNGCMAPKQNGAPYARASCGHERRQTKPMYRFQLQLTDRTPCPPATVTTFDQAHVLTGLSAEEFPAYTAEGQRELVREATNHGETVDLYLKVKEDNYSGEFVCIVQMLKLIVLGQDYAEQDKEVFPHIIPLAYRTPSTSPGLGKSPGTFHTPIGSHNVVTGSGGSQSSLTRSGRGVGHQNRGTMLDTVKSKSSDLKKKHN